MSDPDLAAALIAALEANSVNPPVTSTDLTFDILLAEDNLVNQRLAVRILEKYGHIVEIAENGSVALNKFKDRVQRGKTSFDVILVSRPRYFLARGTQCSCRWMCRCHSWGVWKLRSLLGHMKPIIILSGHPSLP